MDKTNKTVFCDRSPVFFSVELCASPAFANASAGKPDLLCATKRILKQMKNPEEINLPDTLIT
jgi:hypothetical protein